MLLSNDKGGIFTGGEGCVTCVYGNSAVYSDLLAVLPSKCVSHDAAKPASKSKQSAEGLLHGLASTVFVTSM